MEAVRQILSVLVVFLLLGLALWKLRRQSPGGIAPAKPGRWFRAVATLGTRGMLGRGGGPALEGVARLALTPQHTLHLVRVQGCNLLVATHPQGCILLPQASVDATAHAAAHAVDQRRNGFAAASGPGTTSTEVVS